MLWDMHEAELTHGCESGRVGVVQVGMTNGANRHDPLFEFHNSGIPVKSPNDYALP